MRTHNEHAHTAHTVHIHAQNINHTHGHMQNMFTYHICAHTKYMCIPVIHICMQHTCIHTVHMNTNGTWVQPQYACSHSIHGHICIHTYPHIQTLSSADGCTDIWTCETMFESVGVEAWRSAGTSVMWAFDAA